MASWGERKFSQSAGGHLEYMCICHKKARIRATNSSRALKFALNGSAYQTSFHFQKSQAANVSSVRVFTTKRWLLRNLRSFLEWSKILFPALYLLLFCGFQLYLFCVFFILVTQVSGKYSVSKCKQVPTYVVTFLSEKRKQFQF